MQNARKLLSRYFAAWFPNKLAEKFDQRCQEREVDRSEGLRRAAEEWVKK